MADIDPAIALRAVSKSFDQGASFAVRDLSLAVPKGQFLAIIGGSGSGKTTTLKMINRLIEPDSGEILIEGEDIRAREPALLRRAIGYVIQGVGLFPHLSVAENIAITPRLLDWPQTDIDTRVAELLDLVDLPQADFAHRMPHELSGGQKQRIGVARALAARPHIMLMDEPFGALDPITRDGLGETCRALHDKFALTTILITHDMQEALMLADRIVIMSAGELIADGAPHDLLNAKDERVSAFLDTPRRQAERVRARPAEQA